MLCGFSYLVDWLIVLCLFILMLYVFCYCCVFSVYLYYGFTCLLRLGLVVLCFALLVCVVGLGAMFWRVVVVF